MAKLRWRKNDHTRRIQLDCVIVQIRLLVVMLDRIDRRDLDWVRAHEDEDMKLFSVGMLFVLTAVAEIVGCYLPYLWLRQGRSIWLLVPAMLSLMLFAWLLTLHPTAAGRVYAAYGGVYVCVALIWLWFVDGIRPGTADLIGVGLCLAGMAVITLGARP